MIFKHEAFSQRLPLPANDKWQDGVWDVDAFKHGTMSLLYFEPRGVDYQTPHDQDELYFVIEGAGEIEIDHQVFTFGPGDAIFVKAGQQHRFLGELAGLKIWAVFYGPSGGE